MEPDPPAERWFIATRKNTQGNLTDGVYEAIDPYFNGNPHCLERYLLKKHGQRVIRLADRSFEGIRAYLEKHVIEGIVFWKDGVPQCKIKRRDFGLQWSEGVKEMDLHYGRYQQ